MQNVRLHKTQFEKRYRGIEKYDEILLMSLAILGA